MCTLPQTNFTTPIDPPPKIGQKPHGPSHQIFKPCASLIFLEIIDITESKIEIEPAITSHHLISSVNMFFLDTL